LVALANVMRLSLMKAAPVVASRAAWQEIRVRFGRDDNFGLRTEFSVSTKGPPNRRSLGFARDDKGKGNGSIESDCWTEAIFLHLGQAIGP
jgi:hypothetical protein